MGALKFLALYIRSIMQSLSFFGAGYCRRESTRSRLLFRLWVSLSTMGYDIPCRRFNLVGIRVLGCASRMGLVK